jgi:hypothetical protein
METGKQQLETILKFYEIPYVQITRNALNTQCPFCDDEKMHLGMFYSLNFSCWKCKASGGLFDFLHQLRGVSWPEYKSLLLNNTIPVDNISAIEQIQNILVQKVKKEEVKDIQWPPAGSVEIKKVKDDLLVKSFLAKRKFDLQFCIDKQIRIGIAGRYTGRFIIPVYFLDKVVAYQARDMIGQSPAKYLSEGLVSNFVYNIDHINPGKPVGITEGVFSSWSVENSIATFSTALSEKQINLMRSIDAVSWILCWDIGEDGSDAYWKARPVLHQLCSIFGSSKIGYITLPRGEDPDTLGKEKMKELLKCPKILS